MRLIMVKGTAPNRLNRSLQLLSERATSKMASHIWAAFGLQFLADVFNGLTGATSRKVEGPLNCGCRLLHAASPRNPAEQICLTLVNQI